MAMSDEELIARLDALDVRDPEVAHAKADDLLLDHLPADVRIAYNRVASRAEWWASA